MDNTMVINDGNADDVHRKTYRYKIWKAMQKKLKRTKTRKECAKIRGTGGVEVAEKDDEETFLRDEAKRRYLHELWVQRENVAQAEFRQKLKEAEKRKKIEEEEAERIRSEWHVIEAEEKEKIDEKDKVKFEKETLLQEVMKHHDNNVEPYSNPPGIMKENCMFFMRSGACRYGDRCSRVHPVPEHSTVLMFYSMYQHFGLDHGENDEFDSDLTLEYEDSERNEHFKEFYYDVLAEFKKCGRVVQFKVSCNYEPHLRGNTYVQYSSEAEAQKAFSSLNGRWYGGKQLSCEFTNITLWRQALCGLSFVKRCPKGKNCNFLHVYRNPNNEFSSADRDFEDPRSHRSHRSSWSERSIRRTNQWSHRSRRSYSKSISRSPRHSRRHRSPSSCSSSSNEKVLSPRKKKDRRSNSQRSKKRHLKKKSHREGSSKGKRHSRHKSHKKANKQSPVSDLETVVKPSGWNSDDD